MHPKREILEAVLGRSWAFVQIDSRAAGVDLPDGLPEPVTLQIGYDMPVPIHDLAIDEQGVVATLSFRRVPHRCVVPWSAIFAITDAEGKGVMFPADVPADLQASGQPQPQIQPRPQLQPQAAAPSAIPEEPTARLKNGKPRPSHLKLVP